MPLPAVILVVTQAAQEEKDMIKEATFVSVISVIHHLPPEPPKKERKPPNQMLIPLLCPLPSLQIREYFPSYCMLQEEGGPSLPTRRLEPNSTQAFWKLRLWLLISSGAVQ